MGDRLSGKIAVITGGASGIGEATARLFVDQGARVVIADIQDDRGHDVASSLGDAAVFRRCDVSSEQDVADLVDTAVTQFGRLDVMFNNAGIIGAVGPIDQLDIADYDMTMNVLARSVALGMKHAARVMKPQEGGVILSTSSIAAVRAKFGPHTYSAAKTAVLSLTRTVAAELGAWGIRVVAIVPGKHATPMTADAILGDATAVDATLERFRTEHTPLIGRAGLAADIAHAALWLASDDAGFVSGHALVVDGGLTTGSPENPTRAAGVFATSGPVMREAGQRGRANGETASA
jgi:NAD(P)-dependent dehydrogenase (short-subunit alcohol dehydrogenase family)